jgi:uncharacterized membrane protein SpoIIM required for sporulation
VLSFSQAFRSLCHDLAIVRSRGFGRDLDRYVNDLVVRGHSLFYGSRAGAVNATWDFLAAGFPRLVRRRFGYFLAAFALLVLPGMVSGLVVGRDSSLAVRVLPGPMLQELEQMYSPPREGVPSSSGSAPFGMTGFYVWNNAGIAFRCFATGIFFGLGTVYYLVYNGIVLGTVAGFLVDRGHSERFFTFVVGHGSFELTAIVIAGAAGLRIGHALLHPAPYRFGESLRRRGQDGAQLAVGAGAMLVVAAVVEAFWSPLPIPPEIKYAAGAIGWVVVAGYLVLAGRRTP